MNEFTPEFEALVTANVARLRDVVVRYTRRLPSHEFERVLQIALETTFMATSLGFDPTKESFKDLFEDRVESAATFVQRNPLPKPIKVKKELTLVELAKEARRYRPIGSEE